MIIFVEVLRWAIACAGGYFAYQTIRYLLPIRKGRLLGVLAFFPLIGITDIVIYLGDIVNILGALLGFYLYVFVFFGGSAVHKISVVTMFYPLIVSVNYLCMDAGSRVWYTFFAGHAENGGVIATVIFAVSLIPRFLLLFGVWQYSKRRMAGVDLRLNTRMWLMLDSICAAMFVGLLVVLNTLPETPETRVVGYAVALTSIVAALGCFALVIYMAASVETSYRLRTLQAEHQYYEDKLKDEERVRAVYHDMKNHLLVLQSAGSGEEAGRMAASIGRQIADYENYYQTGNRFLDVIIRDKAEKAKAGGIDFSVMLHFEDGGFIAPLDISAIFGNALDNAIEASLKLPAAERLVTVKANRVHDMLSIVIENRAATDAGFKAGAEPTAARPATAKPDKLLHGFGLKNIEQAVAKYDGQCSVSQKDGRFALTIIIPVP